MNTANVVAFVKKFEALGPDVLSGIVGACSLVEKAEAAFPGISTIIPAAVQPYVDDIKAACGILLTVDPSAAKSLDPAIAALTALDLSDLPVPAVPAVAATPA